MPPRATARILLNAREFKDRESDWRAVGMSVLLMSS